MKRKLFYVLKVEDIKSPIDSVTCALHSFYLPEKQKRKHCGKAIEKTNDFIFRMLLRNTFYPNFSSIYYFYQHEQPKLSTIACKVNNFITKFSGFEFISQLKIVCLCLTIRVNKFSMTKNFQNLQLPDAIETLV